MLIQFTFVLVVLVAVCGLVLDIGLFELKKIQLQNAADAAAIGAMYGFTSGASQATWTSAGQADAALNGFTNGIRNITVSISTPTTGLYAGNSSAIQATVSQGVTPIFFSSSLTLSAQATVLTPSSPCVYLMSQYSNLQSFQAFFETIQSDCSFYLGRNYNFDDHTTSTGAQYLVAGSSTASTSTSFITPTPRFNAPSRPDPLSYIQPPPIGPCLLSNGNITVSTTLSPGTYCNGLNITGEATVTMKPGTYVIFGNLNINSCHVANNCTITGNGVTFYMSGNAAHHSGQGFINNAFVTLSAPTSGPLQGILYYVDRGISAGQSLLNINNMDSGSRFDGILYLLGQQFQSNNNKGALRGNNYFGIIADYAQVNNETLIFSSNYSSLDNGNPFHSIGARLVE